MCSSLKKGPDDSLDGLISLWDTALVGLSLSVLSRYRAEPGYQLARQQLQVSSCQSMLSPGLEVSVIFKIGRTDW